MLILTRRISENLILLVPDGNSGTMKIKIRVLGRKADQVRLGFDAPKSVVIHREEIYERIRAGETVSAELIIESVEE